MSALSVTQGCLAVIATKRKQELYPLFRVTRSICVSRKNASPSRCKD